jgi:hypothetical protein
MEMKSIESQLSQAHRHGDEIRVTTFCLSRDAQILRQFGLYQRKDILAYDNAQVVR